MPSEKELQSNANLFAGGSEEYYAGIREQTLKQMEESGGAVIQIGDTKVPLSGVGYTAVWALLNLILAIFGVILGVFMLALYFKRKKPEEEEETGDKEEAALRRMQRSAQASEADAGEQEDERTHKKHFIFRICGIVCAILGVIAFMLTENMRYLMVFIDKWTLLMIVIAAATTIFAVLVFRKSKVKEDEEEEQNSEGMETVQN